MARQPARRSKAKPPAKKLLTVNRRLFQAWTEGIILERDAKGSCLVTDDREEEFQAVVSALEAGETLYLTDDRGQIRTQITGDGKGYTEEEYTG
jgi:hypothetical protein